MSGERTLINASHIIAHDGARHRHLRDGVVVYEGDTIIFVGRKFRGETHHRIDATNRIVAPGFIDTHIHMAGSPLDKSFVEDHGKRNFFNSGLFEMLPALQPKPKPELLPELVRGRLRQAELLEVAHGRDASLGAVANLGLGDLVVSNLVVGNLNRVVAVGVDGLHLRGTKREGRKW